MIDGMARGLAGAIACGLGVGVLMLIVRLLTWPTLFEYPGKTLKGGYICEVCGKPIIGKNATHTKEECVTYRSRPYQPDHACYYGADKYTRMPDYHTLEETASA